MSAAHDLEAVIDALPADWCAVYLGMTSWVRARLGWRGLKADEYVDEGFAFLSTPDIKERIIDYRAVNRITEERFFESPEIALNVGDVLLTKDGSTIGIVHVVRSLPEPTTVNGSIAVITPSQYWEPIFLGYLLESWWAQSLMRGLQDGMGVPHLFQRDIKRMKLPCPPLETQQRIADYLEREIAEIDAAVADLDRYVKLLEKRGKVLIEKTVIGGTNSFSPLWSKIRVQNGFAFDSEKFSPTKELPVAKIGNVLPGDFSEFIDASELPSESFLIKDGDLVVGMSGDFNRTIWNKGKAALNQRVCILKPIADDDIRYINYAIGSGLKKIHSTKFSTTLKNLSTEEILAIRVPHRTVTEQKEIATYLDKETAEINDLVVESKKLRDLLLKRRSVLITDVVTGRKQV